MAKTRGRRVTMRKKGKRPISFQKGALHRQLGVPEGQPISASKKRAALAGRYGPQAKKRASFGFRGALAKGRQTAAAHKRRRKGRGKGRR